MVHVRPSSVLFVVASIVLGVSFYFRWKIENENMQVTSWWRSTDRNRAVGGVMNSKHLFGWAFDVVPVNDITGAKLKRMGFAKVLNEGDHFHVEIV